MIKKFTNEIAFFKSHPLGMRVLLLTNLIYGLVMPIIELFVGAYIMRNSSDISLVVVFQLAVYTGIPTTFMINGFLLKRVPISRLYSLGMLLYRMVTDKLPFEAKTSMAYFARHLYAEPTPLTEHIADLPDWLGSLIMRLLRKKPDERIQTAAEVVKILDEGAAKLLGPPTDPEAKRLAALRSYRVLDTEAEQAFDDLTFLASHICGTPIALVSLIEEDRQWFKSKVGLSITQTARNISFCQHTIRGTTPLVVGDAPTDPRFADNPAVCQAPHIRFYAGVPLIDDEGCALGTLCVVDRVSKNLTPDQVSALAALGRLVMSQLSFRRELLEHREGAESPQ